MAYTTDTKLAEKLIDGKVKHPSIHEMFKVTAETQDGEPLGFCVLRTTEDGYQVIDSSVLHGLKKPFRSNSVYSAAQFVLREKLQKYKSELGLCQNGMGPELKIYKLEFKK